MAGVRLGTPAAATTAGVGGGAGERPQLRGHEAAAHPGGAPPAGRRPPGLLRQHRLRALAAPRRVALQCSRGGVDTRGDPPGHPPQLRGAQPDTPRVATPQQPASQRLAVWRASEPPQQRRNDGRGRVGPPQQWHCGPPARREIPLAAAPHVGGHAAAAAAAVVVAAAAEAAVAEDASPTLVAGVAAAASHNDASVSNIEPAAAAGECAGERAQRKPTQEPC
mmetsp:Transcript_13044/g.39517  ORF Transcript_13044/g.39517 Transcript_13044/m.39517 type:complete len:222 (+) Transcript_13044:1511-2176(+)